MSRIMIRPDMKTAGGETSDIVLDGRFIGTLTLVYRENDRLSGSIQLEENSFDVTEKEEVELFVTEYIQAFSNAVNALECSVVVTHSPYEHIVNVEEILEVEDDLESADGDELEQVELYSSLEDEEPAGYYELVAVNEHSDEVEYHIYDDHEEWIAEAFVHIDDRYVHGDIHWLFDPSEEEADDITELLVSDFDEEQIDQFDIHHFFEDEMIFHLELYSSEDEDVLELGELDINDPEEEDYTVVLARDDGDTLIYEIYRQSTGGLPIGSATIDIGRRKLTGFIDFRDPACADDSEIIAALLMQELDNEKHYDSLNLTMLHNNEAFEEMLIESETVH